MVRASVVELVDNFCFLPCCSSRVGSAGPALGVNVSKQDTKQIYVELTKGNLSVVNG